MPESLDISRKDPAYVCGRLLGILERLQRAAMGDVNASIIDRYFGAASTSPRIVFPRLIDLAEKHLGKLRGDNPSRAKRIQNDMEEAMLMIGSPEEWIGELPPTLSLEARGRFAIGFYHERARVFSKSQKPTEGSSSEEPETKGVL